MLLDPARPAPAPRTSLTRAAAIEWMLLETRGPAIGDPGNPSWTVRSAAVTRRVDAPLSAMVAQGVARDPLGDTRWKTRQVADEIFLLADADPVQAAADTERGASLLLTTTDAAVATLAPFAVDFRDDVPAPAGSVELLLRRADGERERYVVPAGSFTAALRDAIDAAGGLAATTQQHYRTYDA